MTDTHIIAGGRKPLNSTTYNPTAFGADFPVGTPAAQSTTVGGSVVKGRAQVANLSRVTGLAAGAGVDGNPTFAQFAGPLTLTTAQWDVVTGGSGGLTRGVPYYLSPGFVAGRITATRPTTSGHFIVPVGIALSPTDLLVRIETPVEIP